MLLYYSIITDKTVKRKTIRSTKLILLKKKTFFLKKPGWAVFFLKTWVFNNPDTGSILKKEMGMVFIV